MSRIKGLRDERKVYARKTISAEERAKVEANMAELKVKEVAVEAQIEKMVPAINEFRKDHKANAITQLTIDFQNLQRERRQYRSEHYALHCQLKVVDDATRAREEKAAARKAAKANNAS